VLNAFTAPVSFAVIAVVYGCPYRLLLKCCIPVAVGTCASAVVKALCYEPQSCGIETRKGVFFLIHPILPAALGPEAHSASNRNEYQKKNDNVSRE
jgi:hypothetical protein